MSLSQNPKKPAVEIPEGAPPAKLVIEDLVVGQGAEAVPGKTVVVHYVGMSWSTRKEFDASWERRQTFEFPLGGGRVIRGWDEGVKGMKVGGRRRLVIPPELGYGARGVGPIKPNETLVFVVDLIDIR
jgi:peptidylprolyl isomerase